MGGTNGKGSVCALVAAALRASGRRVGMYTSPHLVSVCERSQVDGVPMSEDAFAMWTSVLAPAIEAEEASFFEAGTVIALADMAARGAEIAVVEVGMGGRLDSTNVVRPVVSTVVRVAADHLEYLGPTLGDVAWEKAHIAKPAAPFVIGETDPALVAVLDRVARERGAVPVVVPSEASWSGELGLQGAHQRRNAAVARAVLQVLPPRLVPEPEAVARGFASARLPGRLDVRGRWIMDVAHNEDGVAALVAALGELQLRRPLVAVVAILADKDWAVMLRMLASGVDALVLTVAPTAPKERLWDPAAAARALGGRVVVETDFDRALETAAAMGEAVLVTGSFHTVGDAMARLPGFGARG